MIGTLTASSKLNRSHFLYKRICTEIISIIFLHQTKCLITWHHNIQCDILIVHQKNIGLCCPFRIGFHIMLQKLLVQTYHFLSDKEKDASHILWLTPYFTHNILFLSVTCQIGYWQFLCINQFFQDNLLCNRSVLISCSYPCHLIFLLIWQWFFFFQLLQDYFFPFSCCLVHFQKMLANRIL